MVPTDRERTQSDGECTQSDGPPKPAVAGGRTRRSVLALLGGGALTAALAALGVAEADAAPKRGRKQREKGDAQKPGAGAGARGPGAAAAGGNCVTANERELLRLINDYRAANGRAALAMSDTLAEAAYFHSRDMAARNYLSHTTPGTGATPAQRMTAAGYPYIGQTAWGEIIYRGSGSLGTPQAAFAWWKNSPGHNALMLDARFTTVGVGRSNNSGASPYVYSAVDFAGKFDRAAPNC